VHRYWGRRTNLDISRKEENEEEAKLWRKGKEPLKRRRRS
jgi:hypothetical protein